MSRRKLASLCLAVAAVACSSAKVDDTKPGAPCATPSACPASTSDLSGTWDVVGASPGGTPESGTISIAKNVFVLKISDAVLSYVASGDTMSVTWTLRSDVRAITTSRTSPTTQTHYGILPLDFGGGYTFAASTNPADSCNFDGELGAFSGGCAQGGADEPVSRKEAGKVFRAARVQTLDSQFGDLGGVWKDPNGSCSFTFSGSTISSECADNADWLGGKADLVFVGMSTASGKTSNGVEYSAKRR